ncbi:hypothetical protein TRP66_15025 [Pseudomonas sp. JDS28PS106]|uniref:hypothetical protein n=1 Tax=Pseudomonas sp. JDS28PS106 TaxID=2497235 RepID=UPI002FD6CE7B
MNKESRSLLPAPSLPQLNTDGTLSMDSIRRGVIVTIPVYPSMKEGDRISVPWEGKPEGPVLTFPVIETISSPIEPKTYIVAHDNFYSGWETFKVWYHVSGVGDSEAVEVLISK